MAPLGRAALLVAFGCLTYAAIAGGYAAARRRRRLSLSARNALVAAFGATAVATGVLVAALLRHDFTFTYVAEHTSAALPARYRLSALWGGQEGSLLFWLLVLTGYSSVAVYAARRAGRDLLAWVVPILGGIGAFFAFLVVAIASPFQTQTAPPDGLGLTPSLQNPYMLIHPPLLYLGYVGLSVPFAFAMATLLARRGDEMWIIVTRRWTLLAWTFLGIGQLLGAHWAYVEVGWGGYYAWDPVENAALMPWLAATAFLHSVLIQEKRGMLKVWNMLLVVLAFCLAIFGDFLTRAGVINSIHSFAQGKVGPWLLGFICAVTAGSLALVFARLDLLRARTRLESLVSREATFLYNNLLLVALCLTILWGVAFPLLSEAVRGQTVTIARPYYDFFLRIFGLPLLLLMGIGPLVAWRRASLRALGNAFLGPALLAVATGIVLVAIGIAGSSAYQTVREQRLRPGQSMEVAGYRLAFQGTTEGQSSNAHEARAHLSLSQGGRDLGTISPGKNYYPAERSSSNEIAIRHRALTLEDVYVIADQINPDGSVYFKVLVKPLVNLLWIAGGVFLLGSLIALWPDAREERRLAARYRTEGALVHV